MQLDAGASLAMAGSSAMPLDCFFLLRHTDDKC